MKFPLIIPEVREIDVLGFGTNAVDFLISVPEFPQFASKIELSKYERAAGGEVATTMVGLQRLGLRTSYSGRFGDDNAGEFGIESLRNEGVDLEYASKIAGAETQVAFILIDEATGERTVIWKRDARLAFSAEDVPVEALKSCRLLHMTPHDTAACIELARAARVVNVLVSLDIDRVFDGVEELLPLVDILISSSEFPSKLLGIDDPRESLNELHSRFGNTLVGVTLGDRGSLLLCQGEFIESTGYAVPGGCKDTTGAGDAFRVGLIYGLLAGESIETASRRANAVAALKCRRIGARTALPTLTELDSFLKKS